MQSAGILALLISSAVANIASQGPSNLSWTLQDAVNKIMSIEQQLMTATAERNELRQQLQSMSSRVVPVGSIYLEYFNQTSPVDLWPDLEWEDITGTYAGMFFRASGGGSETWGTTQAECSPRIAQMNYRSSPAPDSFPNTINLPSSGWSDFGWAGEIYFTGGSSMWYEGLRFNIENCEVRPKNQAIRIWKRVA